MSAPVPPLPSALARFRQAVEACGASGVFADETSRMARCRDTLAVAPDTGVRLVLKLTRIEEIRRALAHARTSGISIHAISSGHNWGYGTSRPADETTYVLFDLSRMNRILAFDAELGIVTLEPGVTQGQLDAFLRRQGADFMVPTTGAGPSCSLIGNALERGYGMTPVADHFQAVLGLSALYADGQSYHSALAQSEGDVGHCPIYRWGVGPYLDGLFSQNGGAIVTGMTLQLMPRPARVEMFVFWLADERHLEQAIEAIRSLMTRSGLTLGGINLMNAARVGAMAGTDAVNGAPWIGTGIVYGDPLVVSAGRKLIRKALKPVSRRIVFINERRLWFLERMARLPLLGKSLAPLVASVGAAYRMLSGTPGEFALALAYGGNPTAMPDAGLDPARDGCGLLWYAPLVPMRGPTVRLYTQMVARVCGAHGFAAPITFSTLSVSGFDSTVPLIFSPDAQNSTRALTCLRALICEGRRLGFQPYRFHAALMEEATAGADPFWQLAGKLRAVLDPEGVISPGRYMRPHHSAHPIPCHEKVSV
jgi:4-cresol dehydrogenase (hydroxylating)